MQSGITAHHWAMPLCEYCISAFGVFGGVQIGRLTANALAAQVLDAAATECCLVW
jgi:hypothetical protein